MTLDVGEETQASHSRFIVLLRGGERLSQDIAHSVVGMPEPEVDLRIFSRHYHSCREIAFVKLYSITTENELH